MVILPIAPTVIFFFLGRQWLGPTVWWPGTLVILFGPLCLGRPPLGPAFMAPVATSFIPGTLWRVNTVYFLRGTWLGVNCLGVARLIAKLRITWQLRLWPSFVHWGVIHQANLANRLAVRIGLEQLAQVYGVDRLRYPVRTRMFPFVRALVNPIRQVRIGDQC